MNKIPGKLIFFGEYAVTKGGRCVVGAVDLFLDENENQLIGSNNQKLGLGSSGAKFVLQARQQFPDADDDEIFEIALKNSRIEQPNNSGSDVAASTYTGLLLYQNDKVIQKLHWPEEWNFDAINSGIPAKTDELILKNNINQKFLDNSETAIDLFLEAIIEINYQKLQSAIKVAQDNLMTINNIADNRLADLLKKYPDSKISGAGFGDNIIAFSQQPINGGLGLSLYYK